MGKTMKFVSGLVAVSTVLVSCGGGDSSSGRTRNGVIEGPTSKCITAATSAANPAGLDINFCQEAVRANIVYGDIELSAVEVSDTRQWSSGEIDLSNVKGVRVQSIDANGGILSDETIELTFDDVTKKSCGAGGACKVGDAALKGGHVFYVSETPQTWGAYLVMLPRLGEKLLFGCDKVQISGTENGVGKGISNTQIISNACKGDSPIINALEGQACCVFLPTRDEVVLAAKNLQGIEGFDMRATAENGYARPAVSDMPVAGVDGVSENEVHRRARTVDFFSYPNWSHMEVMRTMSELAIWPIYPIPSPKPSIAAVTVRSTTTNSSATETPTTIGEIASPVCSVAKEDIIDNAGGDYTTGDLPKTFECADVHGANFTGRDLRRLSFEVANVSRANFTNANLEGANFTNANCRNANFTGANLTGAIFSGDYCPDPSTDAPSSSAVDLEAVATECRDSVVVPRVLEGELTTDAPVRVTLEQGCEIPESLSKSVKVFYDIVVSGRKYFTDWGNEHEIREISPTTLEQVLPADTYQLTYMRWVVVQRDNGPQADMGLQGSFQFEVKEGQTVVAPSCSLSDLTFENSTLSFPCSATPNLAVTHVTWDGDASRVEGAQGKINLEAIPAGWQRISLTMSGELVNNSWAFIGCHTKCGPVVADSNYRITKSDGTVSVNVPKCSASETSTIAGYLTPLFKVARGLLHVPTTQLNQDPSLTSFESPTKGFYVLQRDVTITMSKSDLMAGVLFSESDQCIAGVYPLQLSIFEPTVDDVTKIELPQAETSYPVVLNTTASSGSIVVPEGTTSVGVTVASEAVAVSAELSLDGEQWVPVVAAQAIRVAVDKNTKVHVRTVDKDGVEKVTVQEVVISDAANVVSAPASSSSELAGSSPDDSLNLLRILILTLALIFILFILNLIFKLIRK